MKETKKSSQEILKGILSDDRHKIWEASCEICSLSQNHLKIMELAPYKEQIIDSTKGVELGGAIYRNDIHLKKALAIIEFHEKESSCPCCLLGEFDDPNHWIADGYFSLVNTVYMDGSSYVDYYILCCSRCKATYKVEEREYHSLWWRWIAFAEKPAGATNEDGKRRRR